MAEKKRKYLLFTKADGRADAQKPCAFFISEAGCRNGSQCQFSHGADAPTLATPAPKPVVYKEEKVEVKVVKKVVKKAEPIPAPEPIKEVVRVPKVIVKEPKVEKKVVVKAAPAVVREVHSAPVSQPQSSNFIDNAAVMNALEAQKKLFEQQLLMQENQFLQQQRLMQQQMMQQNMDAEKVRQQEQYQMEEDRKEQFRAKAASNTHAQTSNDRRIQAEKNKRRKSNESVPIPMQQQKQQAQQQQQQPQQQQSVYPQQQQLQPKSAVKVLAPSRPDFSMGLPISTPRDSLCSPNSSTKHNAKIINEEDEDTKFLFGAVNSVLRGGEDSPIEMSSKRESPNPFLENSSVMRRLSTSGTDHATLGSTSVRNAAAAAAASNAVKAVNVGANGNAAGNGSNAVGTFPIQSTPTFPPQTPNPSGLLASGLPLIDCVGKSSSQISDLLSACVTGHRSLPWNSLALKTQENPRFTRDYTFEGDNTWVRAKAFPEWIKADPKRSNYPSVIALDCEMCETADPVTGDKDFCSLVRISIVNGLDPSEVLLDSLVLPSQPITEWRTNIHGIGPDDLKGVAFTLRHAQAFLLNLCSDRTIMVGHALYHDLKALHIHHDLCIDSAYFYGVQNEPGHHASVRDISDQILGIKLPDLHDSVQDARTALQASAYICKHGSAPLIVRTSAVTQPSLLLHRIPATCTEDQIEQMILQNTQVVPLLISPVVRGNGDGADNSIGKTTIIFSSQLHADLAFDSISGPNRPDKSNKPQKRIYLKGGGYVCIRKA